MAKRRGPVNWHELSHEQRMQALAAAPVEQLLKDYYVPSLDESEFNRYLGEQKELWDPANTERFMKKGRPPTKDVVLGAWRDLDRTEAILELIDNSVDTWLQRRKAYPAKTAPELNIYIDLKPDLGHLTYEDNAGGVSGDKLENLVVPGFSETTPLLDTIGSYKTGGKKAVFRLATEARITTRYWNPAGTSDDAYTIHLDERWMTDPLDYEFPYATLRDKSAIEKGQTRYVLHLRREPAVAPWYQNPLESDRIVAGIRQVYTLLLVRKPELKIFFDDRSTALQPDELLYQFSGTHSGSIDVRPQQMVFNTRLEHEGLEHDVGIEVILGCHTTTGVKEGNWGIDLYGNNRLFVDHDQDLFSHWLTSGTARGMIRGLVNINGPTFFHSLGHS